MRFTICIFSALLVAPATMGQESRVANGPIILSSPQQAVSAMLARSPALRSAEMSRQAVRADGLQAPLRPNPELSIVAENFGGYGGRGEFRGGRAMETTLGLSQRVELGGQRAARIGVAGRNGSIATLEFEAARLDQARDVLVALAEAEAASRNIAVERERARLASETLRVARARVDAGRDPLIQQQRAEVARVNAEISAERARREAELALDTLATLIGATRAELAPRQTWFEQTGAEPRPPVPADPLARMAANPDLARLDAAIALGNANLALHRSTAIPDVTLQGQVRRFQDSGETAFVAGASIPLPIYDRNQAPIARARAELLRAEAEAERGRLSLAASLISAERRAALAWRTAQSLRRDALPAAEQAARSASGGYAEGRFGIAEVLDAQRTVSDARAQLIDAYRDFHIRRAAVERLRGTDPANPTYGAPR